MHLVITGISHSFSSLHISAQNTYQSVGCNILCTDEFTPRQQEIMLTFASFWLISCKSYFVLSTLQGLQQKKGTVVGWPSVSWPQHHRASLGRSQTCSSDKTTQEFTGKKNEQLYGLRVKRASSTKDWKPSFMLKGGILRAKGFNRDHLSIFFIDVFLFSDSLIQNKCVFFLKE